MQHHLQARILSTDVPPGTNTGLAAVNVNDARDWRVYYLDDNGLVSQLQGNSSGFDSGLAIRGSGIKGSSIAAVNVNSTTNNIVVCYTDLSTRDLFSLQFTGGAWSVRKFSLLLSLKPTLTTCSCSTLRGAHRILEPPLRSRCSLQSRPRPAPRLLHRTRLRYLRVPRFKRQPGEQHRVERSAGTK
jgi:hypothetical protein